MRKWGPFSSSFPFQATSIIRADPFAIHGLLKEPSPVEPFGQSTGGPLADALGAGALADAGGRVGSASTLASEGATDLLSSLHAGRAITAAAAVTHLIARSLALRMAS